MSEAPSHVEMILDHYERPRHRGVLSAPDLAASGRVPGCGDRVTVYLALGPGGEVGQARFEASGCTVSQAGASVVMEAVAGAPRAQVHDRAEAALLASLGPQVLASRARCARLGLRLVDEVLG
ncbi:MAG: iron-sulfur cluster assembly scaffold protein [Candidatus Dormibacteria bacterium]